MPSPFSSKIHQWAETPFCSMATLMKQSTRQPIRSAGGIALLVAGIVMSDVSTAMQGPGAQSARYPSALGRPACRNLKTCRSWRDLTVQATAPDGGSGPILTIAPLLSGHSCECWNQRTTGVPNPKFARACGPSFANFRFKGTPETYESSVV